MQLKYRRYENLDDDKWNTLNMESNYWGLALSYRFGTAAPAVVAAAPVVVAPLDSDNDGIIDSLDKCGDTPSTHQIDNYGCSLSMFVETTEQHEVGSILFANNSSIVKKESYDKIEKLATYMNNNPKSTVLILGHSSDVGQADYNMMLSDKRANSVANILIEKYRINRNRVSAKGEGITQPIIEGNSPEANKANRRIEAYITDSKSEAVLMLK